MTYSQSERAVPDSDTLATQLEDGEAVLLNLKTHAYYSLNETGAVIWNELQAGHHFDDIVQSLMSRFETTAEQAQNDVTQFVGQLADAQLVEIEPAESIESP